MKPLLDATIGLCNAVARLPLEQAGRFIEPVFQVTKEVMGLAMNEANTEAMMAVLNAHSSMSATLRARSLAENEGANGRGLPLA